MPTVADETYKLLADALDRDLLDRAERVERSRNEYSENFDQRRRRISELNRYVESAERNLDGAKNGAEANALVKDLNRYRGELQQIHSSKPNPVMDHTSNLHDALSQVIDANSGVPPEAIVEAMKRLNSEVSESPEVYGTKSEPKIGKRILDAIGIGNRKPELFADKTFSEQIENITKSLSTEAINEERATQIRGIEETKVLQARERAVAEELRVEEARQRIELGNRIKARSALEQALDTSPEATAKTIHQGLSNPDTAVAYRDAIRDLANSDVSNHTLRSAAASLPEGATTDYKVALRAIERQYPDVVQSAGATIPERSIQVPLGQALPPMPDGTYPKTGTSGVTIPERSIQIPLGEALPPMPDGTRPKTGTSGVTSPTTRDSVAITPSPSKGAAAAHIAGGAVGIGLGTVGLVNSIEQGDTGGAVIAGTNVATGAIQSTLQVLESAGKSIAPALKGALGKANIAVTLVDGAYQIYKEDGAEHKLQRAAAFFATTSAAVGTGAVLTGGLVIGGVAVTGAAVGAAAVVTAGVATGAAIATGVAADTIIDTKRTYESVDNAFKPSQDYRNIKVVQGQLAKRMEELGATRNADGKFDLTKSENVEKMSQALDEKKAELTRKTQENETWMPRWIQFTDSQQDRRLALETAKMDLKILNSASQELPGYLAEVKAHEQKKAQAVAMSKAGVSDGVRNALPSETADEQNKAPIMVAAAPRQEAGKAI